MPYAPSGPTLPRLAQVLEVLECIVEWMEARGAQPGDDLGQALLGRARKVLTAARHIEAGTLTTRDTVILGLAQWHGYREDVAIAIADAHPVTVERFAKWKEPLAATVARVVAEEGHVCAGTCRQPKLPDREYSTEHRSEAVRLHRWRKKGRQ